MKDFKDLRLLVLCDVPMNVNAGGIAQTLYNILSSWNPENMLCISPNNGIASMPPSAPFDTCYIGYDFDFIKFPPNRITQKFKKVIDWMQFSLNKFRDFSNLKTAIDAFKPDVVISCPNSVMNVFMHEKLLAKSRAIILPYFMDDWMNEHSFKWLGGDMHQSIKNILAANKNWLMIGNELTELLAKRYQVKPITALSICNAVSIKDAPSQQLLQNKKEYIIAYAGALWPIHYDAFEKMAKAINILNKTANKRMTLVLYSSPIFWDLNKEVLQPQGVVYGGKIPYKEIHQKLSEADMLLITSSFEKRMITLSQGSLQTKMMDYLKSRKLIVSCGPSYSANHNFIKKYNCGICIEEVNEQLIAKKLEAVVADIENYQPLVQNGWDVLKNEHEIGVVQNKFRSFVINACKN